ncbi:enoyl-CoA hydratase/isomerase family protein [Paraburkholderia silviterrae]|uniref:Enoyl-CoA hydratase/isomerase family protein n=1 Tax=Paraburkholderia silviterrae TaxID=2528715 RepID=A0A4R5M8F3_9BURK|nr:enoyl-CoA hydratase/isomerase family protein [Paraburkholderia silviterrae]TDG22785.1 enoyl-CoA hydratase/isomerase family protein [Paraburkholderia silviterrae]
MTDLTQTGLQDIETTPLLKVVGARADITFNRPSVHNRVHPDDIQALHVHFDQIEADPTVKILVFSGNEKSFSSGFHLGILSESDQGARDFEVLTDRLENLRPITIAKVTGPVYGGSTDLTLACDFRFGRTGVQMFMPAARLGLHYYPHGLRRWVSRLGLGPAKKLFLSSSTIGYEEMLRIGYLDEVHDADRLGPAVDAFVQRLLAQAPTVQQRMKQVLNQVARQEYDEVYAREGFVRSLQSADLKEGLQAWGEKRKPQFQGA